MVSPRPLPHHPACGSAPGGSMGRGQLASLGTPSCLKWLFGSGLHTCARLRPALRRVSSRTRCFMRAMAYGANGDVEIVLLAGTSELGLTTREGEVLAWLSKGKTNRDIVQILGLSPRTVDKHLEQIYAKLGVENRTAAAAIATNATRRNS
ncbi:DNA-binding CsgD family transcriptional regulator [Bradyrhizobium sp. LM6.10]